MCAFRRSELGAGREGLIYRSLAVAVAIAPVAIAAIAAVAAVVIPTVPPSSIGFQIGLGPPARRPQLRLPKSLTSSTRSGW